METTMLIFFAKLFVLWVLVYSVISLVKQVKENKRQARFNRETEKYFNE